MKIKIFNITTRVIYLTVFNEFLYQNKFVIEKYIKFVIKTNTHIRKNHRWIIPYSLKTKNIQYHYKNKTSQTN
jgi:hypothetical protein